MMNLSKFFDKLLEGHLGEGEVVSSLRDISVTRTHVVMMISASSVPGSLTSRASPATRN